MTIEKNIYYDKNMVEKVLNIERDERFFTDEIIKRRFLLEIKLKSRKSEKTVVVIMMNPSKANKEVSDRTINKVIKYIYNNGKTKEIGKIVLLNLFVAYKTI